ncbi:MAG: nitroreductase family protein [Muribaculaceae bacterium]|nr:nitroreductase family protein [Muribaculaceae bacterium]
MEKTDLFAAFKDIVERRYSCRAYQPVAVGRDKIEAVLEMARLAPSACNRQPWRFIVLESDADRQIVHEAYARDWVKTAPAYIVACGDHSTAWHRGDDNKDHTDVDISIAVEHICLAATALGLGTCWICNFDAYLVADCLNLPENLEPIAIIPIGYPADDSIPAKKRVDIQEIVKWGAEKD